LQIAELAIICMLGFTQKIVIVLAVIAYAFS